jgi:hypothetical protein
MGIPWMEEVVQDLLVNKEMMEFGLCQAMTCNNTEGVKIGYLRRTRKLWIEPFQIIVCLLLRTGELFRAILNNATALLEIHLLYMDTFYIMVATQSVSTARIPQRNPKHWRQFEIVKKLVKQNKLSHRMWRR